MGEYSYGLNNDDLNIFISKLDNEMGYLSKKFTEHPSKREYIDKLLLSIILENVLKNFKHKRENKSCFFMPSSQAGFSFLL